VVEQGVAIDLKQIKSFKTPDLQGDEKFSMLYDGTEVIGTEEAIKKEMTETWARVRGPEGEEMKGKMKALRAVYDTSWREGKSRETMEGIAKYF